MSSPGSLVMQVFEAPIVLVRPLVASSPTFTSLKELSPIETLMFGVRAPSVVAPSVKAFSPNYAAVAMPVSASSKSAYSDFPSASVLTWSKQVSVDSLVLHLLFPATWL